MKWEFLDPDFRLFLVGHPSSHTCSPLPWSFCQAEIWCMYPVMFALCEWTLPRMALGLVLQPGHFLLQVAGESWVQVRASSERTCSTVASYMHLPQPIPVTCCFEIVVISDGCFTCANEMVRNWLETSKWVSGKTMVGGTAETCNIHYFCCQNVCMWGSVGVHVRMHETAPLITKLSAKCSKMCNWLGLVYLPADGR